MVFGLVCRLVVTLGLVMLEPVGLLGQQGRHHLGCVAEFLAVLGLSGSLPILYGGGLGSAGSVGLLVDVVQLELFRIVGRLAGLNLGHLGDLVRLLLGAVQLEMLGLVGQLAGLHLGHCSGFFGYISSSLVFIKESETQCTLDIFIQA